MGDKADRAHHNHTFSAFWLRSSVVSVLISLISDRWSRTIQLINSIFLPCLVPGACAILGRGPGTAVPPGAAGGSLKTHNHVVASSNTFGPWGYRIRIAEVNSDRTNLSPFTKDYRGWAS